MEQEPDYLIPIDVHDCPNDPMKPEGKDVFDSNIGFTTAYPSFWLDGYTRNFVIRPFYSRRHIFIKPESDISFGFFYG